jgi:hypothetical protein
MDISLVLNSPIIGGFIALLFGTLGLGAYIVKWWRESTYRKAINTGSEALGNLSAYRLYNILKSIKDDSLRNVITSELKNRPEYFDIGWDLGFEGVKYGTNEYELVAVELRKKLNNTK